MKTKHSALIDALDGRFDEHHGELARMLLDQIDALTTQIDHCSPPASMSCWRRCPKPSPRPATATARPPVPGRRTATPWPTPHLTAVERLDEIPGIGPNTGHRSSSPRSGWT